MKCLVATRNRGKLKEVAAFLAPLGYELVTLDEVPAPEVVEDGATFLANAEKKAKSACAATGLTALADDSGLEVDALGGAPGVLSARFAGGAGHDDDANNRKLIDELAQVPDYKRTARFRCSLVLARPDGSTVTADGACEGMILRAPRGSGGFGYDPLFFVEGRGCTMAELPLGEKNRISHRARALAELVRKLQQG